MSEYVMIPKQALIDAIQEICHSRDEGRCVGSADCLNCIPGNKLIQIVPAPPVGSAGSANGLTIDDMAKALVKKLCSACELQNHCDQYTIDGCAKTDKIFRSTADEIRVMFVKMIQGGPTMMLGNQSIDQIEKRLGIEIPEPDRAKLIESRHEEANSIPKGKWHCFDIPFMIVCGDEATGREIAAILQPFAGEMNGSIEIGWA